MLSVGARTGCKTLPLRAGYTTLAYTSKVSPLSKPP